MLNLNKFEGKTEEEALEKATIKLNCEKENFIYKSELIEGKLFKSSKTIVTVIQKDEIKNEINEYFNSLSKMMDLSIETEIRSVEESFDITLVSSNNSILIGKDGKNLNAIQTLLRQMLKTKTGALIKVNLDISNYKVKKLKNLESDVREIAKEVINTKLDVSLDPMNSYERRYIHSIINEYKNLKTESVGEGQERHIIIKYVEE